MLRDKPYCLIGSFGRHTNWMPFCYCKVDSLLNLKSILPRSFHLKRKPRFALPCICNVLPPRQIPCCVNLTSPAWPVLQNLRHLCSAETCSLISDHVVSQTFLHTPSRPKNHLFASFLQKLQTLRLIFAPFTFYGFFNGFLSGFTDVNAILFK